LQQEKRRKTPRQEKSAKKGEGNRAVSIHFLEEAKSTGGSQEGTKDRRGTREEQPGAVA